MAPDVAKKSKNYSNYFPSAINHHLSVFWVRGRGQVADSSSLNSGLQMSPDLHTGPDTFTLETIAQYFNVPTAKLWRDITKKKKKLSSSQSQADFLQQRTAETDFPGTRSVFSNKPTGQFYYRAKGQFLTQMCSSCFSSSCQNKQH